MPPEVDNSRDDILASITKLEADPDNTAGTPPAESAPGSPPPPAPASTPAAGTPPPPADPAAPSTPGQPPAAATPAAGSPPPPPAGPVVELKAPVSWRPEARERWKTMPVELQQEVLRREREIGIGLQQSAEARQLQSDFQKIAAPYAQVIATHLGGDPMKTFGEYLRTATLLRTGSPQDKAQAVAMACSEYGVDITMLDSYLAQIARGGKFQTPQVQQQQAQQFRDPRVDELLAARDAEVKESVTQELDAFASDPKNVHYEQVREEMADYLEYQASKGKKVTLQQAYDYACRLDPVVQAAETKKSAQNQQLEAARKVAAARAAATPGAGAAAPAPGTQVKGTGTVGDDIRAAMEKLQDAA